MKGLKHSEETKQKMRKARLGKRFPIKNPRCCSDCHVFFPLTTEFFHKNKSERSGFCYECKNCKNERQKIGKHRMRFEILKRDKFTCQYCGRKAPNVILHIDHRFPKSKGGENNIENLVTACIDCNLGKKDILLNP